LQNRRLISAEVRAAGLFQSTAQNVVSERKGLLGSFHDGDWE
jgi:hypothetical protein